MKQIAEIELKTKLESIIRSFYKLIPVIRFIVSKNA
jgi:hypothetical protein